MPTVPSETSEDDPRGYAEALRREFETRRAGVSFSGGWDKADLPPSAPEGLHLPFSVTIDGQPYDTMSTISVVNRRQQDVGPEYGQRGLQTAINEARATYAVVRKPYGNGELFVLPLTGEEAAGGSCVIDSTSPQGQERALRPLNQETPFNAKVAVDPTNEWAMPADVKIGWDRGSFVVSVSSHPDALAMVAQPLPPPPA